MVWYEQQLQQFGHKQETKQQLLSASVLTTAAYQWDAILNENIQCLPVSLAGRNH